METERGIRYRREDCLGLWRRFLIDGVDGVVLAVYVVAVYVGAYVVALGGLRIDMGLQMLAQLAGIFLYLVVLKRWGRTLGYYLVGAQIVSLQGRRPSFVALTIRAMFVCLGPGNMLLDLIWLTGDSQRQAIRDKFARTYVIKKGSVAVSEGRLRYVRLDLLGYNLLLPEVVGEKELDGKAVVGVGAG